MSVYDYGDRIEGLRHEAADVDFDDVEESLKNLFDGNRSFLETHREEIRQRAEAHRRIAEGFVPDASGLTESGWI